MGTGLGGNLPVDGALFIEFIPRNRQNLLTLLSIFWSFGNLVTASFGWSLLPRYSCNKATDHILHDCQSHNNRGWRYVVFAHGLITIVFFFSRFFFFKFHESPKYLLARGRPREALDILYILAAKNKAYDLDIKLEDLMSATDLDNQDKNHCETIDTGSSKKLKISFKTDHLNVLFTKRNARTTIVNKLKAAHEFCIDLLLFLLTQHSVLYYTIDCLADLDFCRNWIQHF